MILKQLLTGGLRKFGISQRGPRAKSLKTADLSETKFGMECVARGVNGMATEMSGAKYEPMGWDRLQ